ncbi:hypothetical protein H5410_010607 [Solanum commersonii]|uniref:Uncharacterized protein n=1 Tax=Solanum commersonii TaxID=4109 RepID=A0A9J6AL79_SOLCO|nr:hypothetical protein H5410_010607 [Solanum commersonii]
MARGALKVARCNLRRYKVQSWNNCTRDGKELGRDSHGTEIFKKTHVEERK